MTTHSTTPCPNCEELRDAFADLLEMAGVDPEDRDELDEPDKIVDALYSKITRKNKLLRESRNYIRSLPDYCDDSECKKPHCVLVQKISDNLMGEEK